MCRHQGSEPFAFILPQEASEGFRLGGAKLRYAAPPREYQIVLSPGRKKVEVELRAEGDPAAGARLEYSNALFSHHAEPAMSGDARKPPRRTYSTPRPQDLWLCSKL